MCSCRTQRCVQNKSFGSFSFLKQHKTSGGGVRIYFATSKFMVTGYFKMPSRIYRGEEVDMNVLRKEWCYFLLERTSDNSSLPLLSPPPLLYLVWNCIMLGWNLRTGRLRLHKALACIFFKLSLLAHLDWGGAIFSLLFPSFFLFFLFFPVKVTHKESVKKEVKGTGVYTLYHPATYVKVFLGFRR